MDAVPQAELATAIYASSRGWAIIIPALGWAGGLGAALIIGARDPAAPRTARRADAAQPGTMDLLGRLSHRMVSSWSAAAATDRSTPS